MDLDPKRPRPDTRDEDDRKKGQPDGHRDHVLDLETDEAAPPPDEITLERNQALKDLRELQELSLRRAYGDSSDEEGT